MYKTSRAHNKFPQYLDLHAPARTLLFGLILAAVFVCAMPGQALANKKYASIVMEADTGLILHQRYADKSLHPASLTKVMTLLMVFEAIEKDELSLNDRIRISNHAANMVPSKLGLKPGSSIKVKDAIRALVTKSANDVAVAVAEHLGGSERSFAKKMTLRARDLGMSRTTFRNASGLHDKKQVTTARDMAKMARYVINVYPEYYRNFSLSKFTYQGKTYRNHNRLMETYKGMDGMKTGYIGASGFNLIASAVQGNRRIIGVVFGGRTSRTRNAHMAEILDTGFSKVKNLRIAKAKVPVPGRKPAIAAVMAALTPAANNDNNIPRMGKYTPGIQEGFERLIGQGDSDPSNASRIETGLLAIAAHKGEAPLQVASYTPPTQTMNRPRSDSWSVQIGAFTSRAATDQVLQKALTQLPKNYSAAQPVIAPLKTADGWLFRARLTGFTKAQALQACNHLRDCLPVAPKN